jgi:hypothetical protein
MKVTVYDLVAQEWVTVSREAAEAGAAAGQYEVPNVEAETLGGSTGRELKDLGTVEALGESLAPEVQIAEQARQLADARRAAYDTMGDKAMTFAEGVVDAASLGLIHDHGEDADIRRQVNSGSALLGQLVGTAGSLGFGGPVKAAAGGGEAVGRGAAKMLLGEARSATTAGKILTRGAEEAAIGAGLMGATSFGHQVSDAIIEDKAFAGEAVLHEMTLGGVLGFGAGALGGAFSAAASRGAIKGQGGLVDSASGQSRALVDEVSGVKGAWRDAAEQYEARVGVLDAQHKMGMIPDEMVLPYRDAAKELRAAHDELEKYSINEMLDAKPKKAQKFFDAVERARKASDNAGEIFHMPPSEARAQRLSVGQPGEAPGPVRTGNVAQGDTWSQHLDDIMLKDPRALEAYERNMGRPYEPIGGSGPIKGEGGLGESAERFVDDVAAPTDKTNAGRKGRQAKVEEPTPATELEAGTNPGRKPQPAAEPWTPSAPEGRFSLSQFSDDTLAGEGRGFRELNRQVDKGDFLNQNHGNRDLGVFPDGHMAPVKDMQANADAFAQFRERALSETVTPSPASVPGQGPVTRQDWNVVKGDGNRTIKGGKPEFETPFAPNRTYKDPGVPRGEPLPKPEAEPRLGDVADLESRTSVLGSEGKTQLREPNKGSPEWEEFQRKAAENYIEKWYWESKRVGRRINPADEAGARIDQAMRQLSELTGGRLDSAGALELADAFKLRPSSDMFVDRLQQVWSLRRAAKLAADEARGVSTELGKSGKGIVNELAKRYARMQAVAIGGAVGGPFGAAAGWVLGPKVAQGIGFGAKAASASGKVMQLALQTGESLLRGRRATVAARAISGNRPYAYDDSGPISDPIKRIQKVHLVASNPDQIRATVRNQLGDVTLQSPAIASAIEETAVRQLANLSAMAPPIQMDPLGRPIQPTQGALRRFWEFENATHDVQSLLSSIRAGATTPTQALALAQQHIGVHTTIVKTLLADPDVLAKKTTAQLRAMELIVGIPLTHASANPGAVMRYQASYQAAQQAPAPQAPQAFKINAPAPTQSQAGSSGRAPGN